MHGEPPRSDPCNLCPQPMHASPRYHSVERKRPTASLKDQEASRTYEVVRISSG